MESQGSITVPLSDLSPPPLPSVSVGFAELAPRPQKVAGPRPSLTVPLSQLAPPSSRSGLLESGNVDLYAQPKVQNPDGTTSTVDSRSYNIDGKEVLLPSVTPDGRHLSTDDQIIAEYQKTGRHLGKFADVDSANLYAEQLHNDYAAGRYEKRPRPEAHIGPESIGQRLGSHGREAAASLSDLWHRLTTAPAAITEPVRRAGEALVSKSLALPTMPETEAPIGADTGLTAAQGAGLVAGAASGAAQLATPLNVALGVTGRVLTVVTSRMASLAEDASILRSMIQGAKTSADANAAAKDLAGTVDRLAKLEAAKSAIVAGHGLAGAGFTTEGAYHLVTAPTWSERAQAVAELAGGAAMIGAGVRAARRPLAVTQAVVDEINQRPATDVTAMERAQLPPADESGAMAATSPQPAPAAPPVAAVPAPALPPAVMADAATAVPPGESLTIPITELAGDQTARNAAARAEAEQQPPAYRDLSAIEAGRALERRVREGESPTGVERRALPPVVNVTPAETEEHKFSSTQVNLPAATAKAVTDFAQSIPDTQIAADGRAGDTPGTVPHVTVKYGLHTTDVDDVRKVLADEPPVTVTLGKTSVFDTDKADVLKVDVDSPDLHALNAKIAGALKTTDTFPEYVPHVTIAYLKKGEGQQYVGDDRLAGQQVTLNTIQFSTKDGQVYDIPLTGTPKEGDHAVEARQQPESDLGEHPGVSEPRQPAAVAETNGGDRGEQRPSTSNAVADAASRGGQLDTPPEVIQRERRSVRATPTEWRQLDTPVRREVRRILEELQTLPFEKKRFIEAGARQGGDLEVSGGAGGAPVYWDIVGGNPERGQPTFRYTRGEVAQKLRAFVESGKRSVVSDLAVDVARGRVAGDRSLSPASLPPDAGNVGTIDVERQTSLSPEQSAVQDRAADLVEHEPRHLIKEYRAKFGDVVNADSAKTLFRDYATPAQRTANDIAVHRPASALAEAVYHQILEEPTPAGKTDTVLLLAGGTGSGKSSIANGLLAPVARDAHVVYDSTLSNFAAAKRQIDAAVSKGHRVSIVFVDRDLLEAFHGTVDRALKTGRPVTINTHVATHLRAPQVFEQLRRTYGNTEAVEFAVIQNRPDGQHLVSLDDWKPRIYNESDVRSRLHEALDRAARAQDDRAALWKAIRGNAAAAGAHDRPHQRSAGEAPAPPEKVTPPTGKPPEGGTTLQSTFLPGGAEFVEQDLIPATQQAAADLDAARLDIKTLFAPASITAAARDFSHAVRANIAARDQRIERARRVTKQLGEVFDRRLNGAKTDAQKAAVLLSLTDPIESGDVNGLPPELAKAATLFRELLDGRRAEVQRLGKLQEYIKNYFPHEWADPSANQNALRRLFGKRPLQGPKAFLKKRSIPTTRDGIEAGLTPVSYNPVDLVLRKLVEMDKFIAATRILKDGARQGLAKYVPVGADAPEGWRRFDHSFATVYGKPTVTVKEAYDERLMEKLHDFAASLGVTTVRKVNIGGKRWGYAVGDSNVVTKFGGPETVLEHEIGHILDEKFGLRARWVKNPKMVKELRTLADLRYEGTDRTEVPASFQKYVRKGEEKIANLVHAFIYNPGMAKDVAPNAYWALYNLAKDTPALSALIDLQKTKSLVLGQASAEVPVGGAVIKGYYYGPPEVVRLLDNHLSPGLRGSIAFNLYRRAGNVLNQVQLGLSAFHLTMTGLESVISKQSLAFELLARGRPVEALRKQLEVPIAPLIDLARGHRALKQFYVNDANAQTFDYLIDTVVQGGGGFGWSLFEHEGASQQFMKALRQGNYPGAALRALPALIELQAKPIMEGWVPRLKMAAFLDLMRMELPTLGPEPDLSELRRVAGDAWDSIDNRFGQLRYDNLFWHQALKDLGMASVRALGWNIGSIREAFGAPAAQLRQVGLLPGAGVGGRGGGGQRPIRMMDVGVDPEGNPRFEAVNEPWLHRKLSWLVATVFVYGLGGAIYQYLHTGTRPAEEKDYFFPHNGDGDTRVSIPGYPKDWYAFFHDLPGSAVETAKHKLNPLLTLLGDLWANEDYFGTEIRNPDDPALAQVRDVLDYLATEYRPISIQNFVDSQASGKAAGVGAVESFFGVNRAPASVSRSALEAYLHEISPPTHRTQAQAAQASAKRMIRDAVRTGSPTEFTGAIKGQKLTAPQIAETLRSTSRTALQAAFQRTTLAQAIKAYELATPEERRSLIGLLLPKARLLAQEPDAVARQALGARFAKAVQLPLNTNLRQAQ